MPRKKRNGSRGSSPEKNSLGVVIPPFSPSQSQYGTSQAVEHRHPVAGPGDGPWRTPGDAANEKETVFQHVQEMFQGRIEAEVIHMVLSESHWKVDEALEKLFQLTSEPGMQSPQSLRDISHQLQSSSNKDLNNQSPVADLVPRLTQLSIPAAQQGSYNPSDTLTGTTVMHGLSPTSPNGTQIVAGNVHGPALSALPNSQAAELQHRVKHGNLKLKDGLRSRLPSQPSPGISTHDDSLLVLSPKTPHVVPMDFPGMLAPYGTNSTSDATVGNPVESAMQAFDSYGSSSAATFTDLATSPQDQFGNFYGDIYNLNDRTSPQPVNMVGGRESQGSASKVASQVMSGFQSLPPPQTSAFNPGSSGLHPILEAQWYESAGERSNLSPTSPGYFMPAPDPSQAHGALQLSPNHLSTMESGIMPVQAFTGTNDGKTNGASNQCKSELRYNPGSKVPIPPKPRGTRKKTLSLNPEEREALENLIEDVIIGGVDEGIIDSDSSDTDSDSNGKNSHGAASADGAKTKEGMPKIYPAQLKVAVKHMKQLPPRFVRRLQNAQRRIEAAAKLEAEKQTQEELERKREELEREQAAYEKETEKNKSRAVQLKEKKKKIRDLLVDLDQYTDEGVVGISKDAEDLSPEDGEENETAPKEKHLSPSECSAPVELPQESTRPVHIGLAKHAQTKPGSNSATPEQHGRASPGYPLTSSGSSGFSPTGAHPVAGVDPLMVQGQSLTMRPQALSCSDLERELLGASSVPQPVASVMPALYSHPSVVNTSAYSGLPLMQGAHTGFNMMDPYFHPSQLSADAPEFVPGMQPFNPMQMMQHNVPPPHNVRAMMQPGDQMSGKPAGQFQVSQVDRLSPQVAAAASGVGRVSPHMLPVNSSVSSMVSQPSPVSAGHVTGPAVTLPLASSQGLVIPKVSLSSNQSTVVQPQAPPPQPGVGVIPLSHFPGGLPYTAYPPPFPPNFALRPPFFPHGGYSAAVASSRGPGVPPPHNLVGHPLHQNPSPQMGRKGRGGPPHQVSGIRHGTVLAGRFPAGFQGNRFPMMRGGAPPGPPGPAMTVDIAKIRVQQLLGEGKKVLVLLRGCPGSGKSTMAMEIQFQGVTLSSDDFFLRNGVYEFDLSLLGDAHEWNQKRAKEAIEAGTNPIVIDNTNCQAWEMKYYTSLAVKHNYFVEIIEPDTPWRFNAKELANLSPPGGTVMESA